jgi:ubiquinone/menaquinone biosynthesis C-methylase UbiE
MTNIDAQVVADFGNEWGHYTQEKLSEEIARQAFAQYFAIFPFAALPAGSAGFDMGCGSGRWARFVAPRVGTLNCIDPSPKALAVARANLSTFSNVKFECASVDAVTLPSASQDFGYCLGVLHHVPDTFAGIRACAGLLKPGAPFLLYLYYNFENRPALFRLLWSASDLLRRAISKLPFAAKKWVTGTIAICLYYPLAHFSSVLERFGMNVGSFPLSDYRNKSLYVMKTDALDRFGTRLEKRFSRHEIAEMLATAGFNRISFSPAAPFWVSISYKA